MNAVSADMAQQRWLGRRPLYASRLDAALCAPTAATTTASQQEKQNQQERRSREALLLVALVEEVL